MPPRAGEVVMGVGWVIVRDRIQALKKSNELRTAEWPGKDYNIVGDCLEVAYALTEELEKVHRRIQVAEGMIMDIHEKEKENAKKGK